MTPDPQSAAPGEPNVQRRAARRKHNDAADHEGKHVATNGNGSTSAPIAANQIPASLPADQTREFLGLLYGEKPPELYIYIWTFPDKKSAYFQSLDAAAAYATSRKNDSDVYVGVSMTTVEFEPYQRIKVSEGRMPAGIAGMWGDLDIAGPGHEKPGLPPDLDTVRAILAGVPQPTVIVFTGGGVQPWWMFREPWIFDSDAEMKRATVMATRWNRMLVARAKKLGYSHDSVGDLARVLRVAGTLNRKIPGQPREVRLLEHNPDALYNPSDIDEILDLHGAPGLKYADLSGDTTRVQGTKLVYRMDAEPPADKLIFLLDNDHKFKLTYDKKRKDFDDPSASSYDLALANCCVVAGWTDQEIVDLIIHFRVRHGLEVLSKLRDSYFLPTLRKARALLVQQRKSVTNTSGGLTPALPLCDLPPVPGDQQAAQDGCGSQNGDEPSGVSGVPTGNHPALANGTRTSTTHERWLEDLRATISNPNASAEQKRSAEAVLKLDAESDALTAEHGRTQSAVTEGPALPTDSEAYAILCGLLADAEGSGQANPLFGAKIPLALASAGRFSDFIGDVKKAKARSKSGFHVDINLLKQTRRMAILKLGYSTTVPSAVPTPDSSQKPSIMIFNRQLPDVRAQAVSALRKSNDPPVVFRRLRELVRFRLDALDGPYLEILNESALRGRLSDVAGFYDKTKNGDIVNAFPPRVLCEDILTYTHPSDTFPVVEAVTRCPLVRADGSIFCSPGFDAVSRMILHPPAGFQLPPIPAEPTRDQIDGAKNQLLDIIKDFPFEGDADRDNFIGFCLTPFIRPLVDVVPMAVFDAPKGGSGKGLLTDVAAIIATGEVASVISPPANREEWPKLLASLLDAGSTFIAFDNLHDLLRSDALEGVLTKPFLEFRPLGHTAKRTVPNRAVWSVTGNNVSVSHDMVRRCYRVRIDPRSAQPHLREDFKYPNLVQHCKTERANLVASLLILIRGWFAAGKPAFGGMALGTYTIWKEMVGGILKNSGFEKFLRNQRQLYSEMDRESEDWEGFLLQIRANLSEFTVKDIVPLIGKLETLPLEVAKIYGQTMSHDKSVPNPFFGVQLGHILRRHCNTRYGPNEVYLERVGENTHTKVTRYAIRRGK